MDVEELPMHKDTYFFGYGIDIENPDEMARQVIELKEENQELKKQLHEASLEIQHLIEQDIDCPSNCNKLRKLRNQQKEFVKWLEEKIKNYELPLNDENKKALGYTLPMKGIYKEVLEKYKEIIGVKDE